MTALASYQAFSHFTYRYKKRRMLVCDLQVAYSFSLINVSDALNCTACTVL
jgi:hypothetical protein